MNRRRCNFPWLLCFAAVFLAAGAYAQNAKTAPGEEFYIVASIDLSKSQLLLKHPTEVTTLLTITNKTKYADEAGKSIGPSSLHAGDTVWVISSGTGLNATALHIRKGPMTVSELHKLYLDYPEIK